MLKKASLMLLAFMFLLALTYNVMAAEVIQGEVVAVDKENEHVKTVTIDDELTSEMDSIEIDIEKAEIGAEPEVGDEVRIAYKIEGEEKVGIRVMNITKQWHLLKEH